MYSLFKIWAATAVQKNWDSELERFIAARKPQTHADLDAAIKDYERLHSKNFA